ncbi:class I SAM-dependent methyltransferase [Litoribacter ruber]|uniref:class I SAM-dependent methyltransferase n=1 Tax=Litoribacter ruber TaxID=702568 RepID=UPI001FEB90D3|nr:methyltransferase domain-containing protein [Litoribacter alkaliphilus]
MQLELDRLTDREFDALYPLKINKLSSTHWTPMEIAKKAIGFMVRDSETRVLDIGSGSGKFCLVAAGCSTGQIYGVEKRESLIRLSRKMAAQLGLRVNFIHADIKSISFKEFDSFYFFNSFGENLDLTDSLDRENSIDENAYQENCRFLHGLWEEVPNGTRVVTYCEEEKIVPDQFILIKSEAKGKLKFWEKRF